MPPSLRRRAARLVPPDRWSIGSVLALVVVAAALLGAFGGLLGAFDFDTLWRAGSAVLHGANPYDPPSSAVFIAGHAFVYPAFVAWLFAPLAALPSGVAWALYLAASAAAIAVACTLLGRPGWVPSALVLSSSATIVGLQMGTVNAWLLLGVAAAWWLRDRRGWLAGVLLGVAVTVKLFLLPMLAWPIIARRYGMAVAAAGSFALLMVVSIVGGPISLATYRHLLSSLSSREVVESWSLASLVQAFGASSAVGTGVAVAVTGGLLALAWRSARRLGEARVASIALLCCLLVSPIVWSSYLVLAAVPLLLVTRSTVPLIIGSALSWAVVVPDVAPALHLVAGIAILALVAFYAAGDQLPAVIGRVRRSTTAQRIAAVVAVAGVAVVLAIVPPDVRNPLPSLLCLAGLGALVARRPVAAANIPHCD